MIRSRNAACLVAALVLAASAAFPARAVPGAGVFVATGSTATGRTGPGLALLGNGKVLIVGNGTAELYDAATGTWTAAASPSVNRTWSVATLLANGKVLVSGGLAGGQPTAATELYDPATNAWSPGPPLSTARWGHTATRLQNGKVLIAGGSSTLSSFSTLDTSELYDPPSNTTSPTGSYSGKRRVHQAVLMSSGKVLIVGGLSDTDVYLPSANLYDPATGLWTPVQGMNAGRSHFASVVLPGGNVLVSGGINDTGGTLRSGEIYNVLANVWTNTANMHAPRISHALALQPNGHVVALGGFGSNSSEVYDPAANLWRLSAYGAAPRSDVNAITLANGAILLAPDGSGSNARVSELYRPVLPRAKTDFSGDLKSDIVFENGAGTRWLYNMNGAAVQSAFPLPGAAPGWTLAGIGDFDGNGAADLLWSNTGNASQYWIYLMSGAIIIGGGPVGVVAGYRPSFIADFDADGKDDILWENASGSRWFYFMNGASVASGTAVPIAAPGWQLVGVGNFNGIHGADLLWMNAASPGSYWIHLLNGATVIGGGPLTVAPGYLPTWIGDMNRDGRADIVWENGTTSRWLYMMNGAAVGFATNLPGSAGGWSIVGVGDYDNSQGLDLLWQNSAAPTQYWLYLLSMSGALIGGGPLNVAPGYQALSAALRRPSQGWTGRISCSKKLTQGVSVTGVFCPSPSLLPDETHDWYVGGPQVGTDIPTYYVAQGSWCQNQWSIFTAAMVPMTFVSPLNVPTFDRTHGFVITDYIGLPPQVFDEYDFPTVTGQPNDTSFAGVQVYPLGAGDVPTISGRAGSVTCSWDLRLN